MYDPANITANILKERQLFTEESANFQRRAEEQARKDLAEATRIREKNL